MSEPVNPYKSPARSVIESPWQLWHWAVPTSLAMVAVAFSAWRHPSAAFSLPGVLVASLLLVVSWAVGRVVSGQGATRLLAIAATGSLSAAISQGWIEHAGSPMTLWAFACIGAGVFAGACSPADQEFSRRPADRGSPR
ncbi:MAG: hypothetical protein KatS3mg110_1483 [Pirellulaceae bacterium]|nr:MAG: hypothetical protein KatS3mg110_1483 [Pirellulaceae bacterium]